MYMYSFGSMIMCHVNLLMVNKLQTDGKLSPWQHNYSGHLKLHMILLSRKDDEWGGKPFTNVYGINQSYHILQINIMITKYNVLQFGFIKFKSFKRLYDHFFVPDITHQEYINCERTEFTSLSNNLKHPNRIWVDPKSQTCLSIFLDNQNHSPYPKLYLFFINIVNSIMQV